ncbi:hypothetical protein QUF90_07900 [Desulfococcaceae bacterium HSG9]|nr:hypothetical protein [Desulfococcaceae bacterium HSG9]
MINRKSKTGRLAALFLLGNVLFNYPILTIFNLKLMFFGIPSLYLYIFTIWSALIIAIIYVTQPRPHPLSTGIAAPSGTVDTTDRSDSC